MMISNEEEQHPQQTLVPSASASTMAQKAMAPKTWAPPSTVSIPCDGHITIGGTQGNGRWTKEDEKLDQSALKFHCPFLKDFPMNE